MATWLINGICSPGSLSLNSLVNFQACVTSLLGSIITITFAFFLMRLRLRIDRAGRGPGMIYVRNPIRCREVPRGHSLQGRGGLWTPVLALLALERGLDPFFSAVGVLDRSVDISNSSKCYTNS